jgi:hypothetical protein
MAGSTLSQLTEPHQQNTNWRSILGYEQTLCARRLQRAAEMVDFGLWSNRLSLAT